MRVLVTGGAGYLGSVLVPELLRAGHEVTVLDSFLYGQTSLLEHCWNPSLDIIRGDARDRHALERCLQDQDAVIPLAAIVGMPACAKRPLEATSTNLEAIRLLLALRAPSQVVLFPTTESGYGIQGNAPCTEDTPLHPISLYAQTKADAEALILEEGNSASFRLGTVFGASPRMRFDLLVNDFVHRALTDRSLTLFEPHFRRNYVHIRDVAAVFLHALAHPEMLGQSYNVGLDTPYTKLELCEEVKKQVPDFWYALYAGGDKMEDPDRRDYVVSHERLARAGFTCSTSLQLGIAELIKACSVLTRHSYTNV